MNKDCFKACCVALDARPDDLPEEVDCEVINKAPEEGFYLLQKAGIWQLYHREFGSHYIDFSSNYYRRRGGIEYLPKAIKLPKNSVIIDATAGWARDSWLLAYRGYRVCLFEKNPFLYLLLKQALNCAKNNPDIAEIAARFHLYYGDSIELLAQLLVEREQFDVSAHKETLNSVENIKDLTTLFKVQAVYLDPMYPARQKSAKVKQDMQILHALLPQSTLFEHQALFNAASAFMQKVSGKIVVKRPKNAEFLADNIPHHSLTAPNTRYDIYLP